MTDEIEFGGQMPEPDAEEVPLVKQCATCHIVKPISEFWKQSKQPDGYGYTCINCRRLQHRSFYQGHKEELDNKAKEYGKTEIGMRSRARSTWKKFGIVIDDKLFNDVDYDSEYAKHEGKCFICKIHKLSVFDLTKEVKSEVLFVDHNHDTHQYRFLLCHDCNIFLSRFEYLLKTFGFGKFTEVMNSLSKQ